MALPLVKRIKKQHPQAKITWICGKVVSDFLAHIPEIDKLIELDETKLLKAGPLARLGEIFKIWKKLAFQHYDQCLYYYYSDLYKLLLVPASWKEMLRFNKNPKRRIRPVPARHHSYEYISVFEKAEANTGKYEIEYPTFDFRDSDLANLPEGISKERTIAFSCGGAKNFLRTDDLRRWPVKNYAMLAAKLQNAGFEIVITGAPSDEWVAEHFNGIPHLNLIGKLSLSGFVAFLSKCRMLITHDSGPLHLADLANTPSMAFFGPTNPGDFRSLHPESKFIWGGENLSCRPCYDGRSYAPCESNDCMKGIEVEKAWELAQSMLNKV